jgi:hypothetical protein
MSFLTYLIFLTYRNQTGTLSDQRDLKQAELRPNLDPRTDFTLENQKPWTESEDNISPTDWFGITVANRGNQAAEYVRLIALVDIGDTDEPLRIPTSDGDVEEVRYASSIQDLNDARADVQTNRERPATVFTNSGKVELRTTLSLAKERDGELIKSPFTESVRKICFEAESPQSITFGFVLAYQDANGTWLTTKLEPAHKISTEDASKLEGSLSLESMIDEADIFPMEDLYPQIEELEPLNEYYARFRSSRTVD